MRRRGRGGRGEREGVEMENEEEEQEEEEEEQYLHLTIREATVGRCSEEQLCLTLRTSNEPKVQTPRKRFIFLLL